MSDAPYIIAAYSVSWVVLASYAIYLVVRGRRARRSLGAKSGASDA
jgi:CcmD family protein